MTRPEEIYRAAHMLDGGPYDEADIAYLLQALFFIRAALGKEAPDHGEIYAKAHDRVNDRGAAK